MSGTLLPLTRLLFLNAHHYCSFLVRHGDRIVSAVVAASILPVSALILLNVANLYGDFAGNTGALPALQICMKQPLSRHLKMSVIDLTVSGFIGACNAAELTCFIIIFVQR